MAIAADTGQVGSIVGVIPLLGGTRRLVQCTGVTDARWGIINHVVREAELRAAARSVAHQLVAGPTANVDIRDADNA